MCFDAMGGSFMELYRLWEILSIRIRNRTRIWPSFLEVGCAPAPDIGAKQLDLSYMVASKTEKFAKSYDKVEHLRKEGMAKRRLKTVSDRYTRNLGRISRRAASAVCERFSMTVEPIVCSGDRTAVVPTVSGLEVLNVYSEAEKFIGRSCGAQ